MSTHCSSIPIFNVFCWMVMLVPSRLATPDQFGNGHYFTPSKTIMRSAKPISSLAAPLYGRTSTGIHTFQFQTILSSKYICN